eukprot:jgi/Bigna1/131277/aug1.13_g5985
MIRSHTNSRSLDDGQKPSKKHTGHAAAEHKCARMHDGLEKRPNELTGQLKTCKRKLRKGKNRHDSGAHQDDSKKQKREDHFSNSKKRTKCHHCGKKGHWEKECRNKTRDEGKQNKGKHRSFIDHGSPSQRLSHINKMARDSSHLQTLKCTHEPLILLVCKCLQTPNTCKPLFDCFKHCASS